MLDVEWKVFTMAGILVIQGRHVGFVGLKSFWPENVEDVLCGVLDIKTGGQSGVGRLSAALREVSSLIPSML